MVASADHAEVDGDSWAPKNSSKRGGTRPEQPSWRNGSPNPRSALPIVRPETRPTALEVATMAEAAADSAERAAKVAREAASRATETAAALRDEVAASDQTASHADRAETGARDRCHEAEESVRRRYERKDPNGL
jgi:hypothetical protein